MNIDEINEEIIKLETGETNWGNIQRLSWLYTVRNNYRNQEISADTDFCSVCAKADLNKVLHIISEHMEVIQVLHPKEYKAVIDRIKASE